MTKSELIERIAQAQSHLVDRDVALAVNMMLRSHGDVPLRRRPDRDPRVRQLLATFPPCTRRPQSQNRNAGIASGEIRPLLQTGKGAARTPKLRG